jgi:hypothetical protein
MAKAKSKLETKALLHLIVLAFPSLVRAPGNSLSENSDDSDYHEQSGSSGKSQAGRG